MALTIKAQKGTGSTKELTAESGRMSVREAAGALNVPSTYSARVNGRPVSFDTMLNQGDFVQFGENVKGA